MTTITRYPEIAQRLAHLGDSLHGALFGRPTVGDLDAPIEQAMRARLPEHTIGALDRYIADHRPIGHFLTAVFSNDLSGAVNHADPENLAALADIVLYVHNCAPSLCWGDPDRVATWVAYGLSVRAVELAGQE